MDGLRLLAIAVPQMEQASSRVLERRPESAHVRSLSASTLLQPFVRGSPMSEFDADP